jgi:hypothetical protein
VITLDLLFTMNKSVIYRRTNDEKFGLYKISEEPDISENVFIPNLVSEAQLRVLFNIVYMRTKWCTLLASH